MGAVNLSHHPLDFRFLFAFYFLVYGLLIISWGAEVLLFGAGLRSRRGPLPERSIMQSQSKLRGFASMDISKQREIASKGGRAAHEKGTAHRFNSEEARQAGRKGGESVSVNRSHMAEIGRIGGKRSAVRRRNGNGAPGDSAEGVGDAPDPRDM